MIPTVSLVPFPPHSPLDLGLFHPNADSQKAEQAFLPEKRGDDRVMAGLSEERELCGGHGRRQIFHACLWDRAEAEGGFVYEQKSKDVARGQRSGEKCPG